MIIVCTCVLSLMIFNYKVNEVKNLEKRISQLQTNLERAKATQKVVTKTIASCEEYIDEEIGNICSDYVSDNRGEICSENSRDEEDLTCEYDTRGKVCY